MKQRRDTFANWAAENPVLLDGELGIVSDDPNLYKVGDGSTAWNALPFRGFDGTLVHTTGDSKTAAMSQKGVTEKLTELSKRIDNLPKGDEFDKQGNYPDLSAGFAENLVGRGESVPAEFSFRASGGKSIKDGAARIKRIKGNSVVWNQKVAGELRVQDGTMSQSGNRYAITPTGEYAGIQTEITELIQGHKYICLCSKVGGSKPLYLNWGGYDSLANAIFEVTNVNKTYCTIYAINENETFTLTRPIICDLTKMFGAGNEPTTIEEYNARKPIVADEYAYNEGEVIHMNTENIKSVGDNAYNRDRAMQGTTDDNTGEFIRGEYSTMVDLIECLPNSQYFFANVISYYYRACVHYYDANMNFIGYDGVGGSTTDYLTSGILMTPANARFMRVGTYVNATEPCMVTLVHSGWKQDTDAGYQEYWQDTLPLPIIRKYFPDGMKKAGSAHDEIRFNKASGKWEAVQRIGSVDLGSLDWIERPSNGNSAFRSLNNPLGAKYADGIFYLCAKYQPAEERIYTEGLDKSVALNNGFYSGDENKDHITIRDTDYTDVESFKASLQGVMLYYELAEPVIREIDEPIGTDYRVADFGTEQAISSIPSAPFSADIIYQFNAVDMIREHELEITQLQAMIATMQAQLASLANL